MKNESIIETIKAQYSRDLRKQLVKTIQEDEKHNDKVAMEKSYKLMNQIFSYVIGELGWSIAPNASRWDNSPLEVMRAAFPQLESTKWYQEQQLTVTQDIDIKLGEKA